jgi:hypothetical protein
MLVFSNFGSYAFEALGAGNHKENRKVANFEEKV